MNGKAYEHLMEFKDKATGSMKQAAKEAGILDDKIKAVRDEMGMIENKAHQMDEEFTKTASSGFRLSKIFVGLHGGVTEALTVVDLAAFGGGTCPINTGARVEQTRISFETILG